MDTKIIAGDVDKMASGGHGEEEGPIFPNAGGENSTLLRDDLPSLLRIVNVLMGRLEAKQKLVERFSMELAQKDKIIREKDAYIQDLKEKQDLEGNAKVQKNLIFDLLSVMDSFERAFKLADSVEDEEMKIWIGGIGLIYKQLRGILKKYQVVPIKSMGEIADQSRQEIIGYFETDEYDENVVVEEKVKGYMMGPEVIRTAKVIVSKKPTK
ncbi:MAG: nucleotide exchange factor GrpE [bacterium]